MLPSEARNSRPNAGSVQALSEAAVRAAAQRRIFEVSRIDWETPPEVFAALNSEFTFTLDPCATPENAKCSRYFTPFDDGLKQSWAGEAVFMNPPYGREIGRWVQKAYQEVRSGAFVVVGLVPARTDTAWWHDYCMKGEVRFLRGRLKFSGGGPAPFPSAVVVWRPQ